MHGNFKGEIARVDTENVLEQGKMPGAGDGQELSEALNQPEQDGVSCGHGSLALAC
jgi:hypothetical protein